MSNLLNVKLRLNDTSEPMDFEVLNAYVKGQLYCMRLSDGSTLKFPLVNIFSIKESNAYTSQKKVSDE